MKTLFCLLIFAIAIGAHAQSSGVYISAKDFAMGKLTYEINCATEKHKIKLNEFLSKDYITVVHNQVATKLMKKEIFGYKDCDGRAFRFIKDYHFTILNPSEELIIFKYEVSPAKGQKAVSQFYFAFKGSDTVTELTLDNLKNSLPENHKFHDALDATFKSGDDLSAYDSFHKMFKVNHIYNSNK